MVFLKDFFEKVDLEKSADKKMNHEKLSRVQRVNHLLHNSDFCPFEMYMKIKKMEHFWSKCSIFHNVSKVLKT